MENPTPTIKTGWKTSEFWQNMGVNVVGLLVLFGIIAAGDQGNVLDKTNEVIGAVQTIVGALMLITTNAVYIWNRSSVKKEEVKAKQSNATVAVAVAKSKIDNDTAQKNLEAEKLRYRPGRDATG